VSVACCVTPDLITKEARVSWLGRLWNTFRFARVQRDIDRELAFHIAERVDQLRAEGLSEDEAARRARLQFGNVTLQAERTRDMDVSAWMEALLRDTQYAIRSLARTPGFTLTVLLTLALGIGANSAVFSVIDAVLLRPLPFPGGDRLMRLRQIQDRSGETNIAPVRLEEWNRLNSTFDAITGYYMEDVSDTSGDVPERVRRAFVAPRFLDVWGIGPAIGRGFTAAEHSTGGASAVLVSDRYWRRRAGADPNVLNRTIRIGNASFPIVGVMPATFLFPDRTVDLWFPVAVDSPYAQSRRATWYTGVGRLKPGVTHEQARANLRIVQAQLREQHAETDRTIEVDVAPLKESTVGGVRRSLWLVFGAVTVLLLITCTNIAALLLSRGAHRQHEIALRRSLGASRAAVTAQMLIEAAVLAAAGGALGLAVAAGAAAALRSAAADLPRMDEIGLDWTVVLYTLASVVAVALLCGLLPAIRSARDDPAGTLSEAPRTQVSTRHSLQWLLVGAQVALSVTLLAGAGLLLRSFVELSRVNPGFEPSGVLTFRVSGNFAETGDYERLVQRIEGTLEHLRTLPGVHGAASAVMLPGLSRQYEGTFALVEARDEADRRLVAESRIVSPEYFAVMQIPVVGGELCRSQPRGSTRAVMLNRTFVTRYLSGWESAIGLHLVAGDVTSPTSRVVGIVGDARERGLDRAPEPTVYTCYSTPNPTPYFLLRTDVEPMALAQTVRLKIKEIEPLRSVYDIAPLEERIEGAFAENRLRTTLLVLFAVAALSLACVGLYGTLSYMVSLRRREVGLRLALGAARGGIVRQFLLQALRVVGVACVCGLALSVAFTRVLSGMLYGVSPLDPVVLAGVVAVVLVIASLAALIPATRAALVEPMQVLRDG
jgi:putative ABC transport system permease protein